MKVLGLIVEYNPFHNGHIYHIQRSIEMIQPDYTIAVMSSSFVQRGEPAIIDKWTRSKQAIEFGVDLVIELPFVYACQSADYFAKGAIDLLYHIGVTDICFGSEDGNIETFIEIAHAIEYNKEQYDQYIQNYLNDGLRYPNACNLALHAIMNKEVRTPNDLLGLSYVKEIIFNHYPITPHCFMRTNDYHDSSLQNIASATAIRQALFTHQDVSLSLPHSDLYKDDLYFFNDFYPFLHYQILTTPTDILKTYHLVEEGLENVLAKKIENTSNMNEYVQSLLSKRYTKPRIQRMLIHILMKNTKEDIANAMNIDYIRILAMNTHGRDYLRIIKKTCTYKLVSNFSSHHHLALDIEFKATKLLSLLSSHPNDFIKKEYQSIPYIHQVK